MVIFAREIKISITMLQVKVINKGHQPLPAYATSQSAGMDLRANIAEPIVLRPMERRLIPTGLHIALPEGYEAQIRPRSGLALKARNNHTKLSRNSRRRLSRRDNGVAHQLF